MGSFSYKDSFSLKGKNAVVTGAVGVLGVKFCEGLAEYGANVAVVDLDEMQAQSFADHLRQKFSINAVGIGCDVSSAKEVERMVETVVEELGSINILLNNAASKTTDLSAFFARFEEYSLEQWRKVMAVNIDGMFLVAQAVGKQMLKQGTGGSIIQTSSIYGILGPDQRIYEGSDYLGQTINTPAVYAASKAGVIGLSRYLAAYWAAQGIRVNTLTPGGNFSGQNEEFIQKYSNRVPLGRMGYPKEMVGALIYLASDASSYVTGQNIIVDGGLSSW